MNHGANTRRGKEAPKGSREGPLYPGPGAPGARRANPGRAKAVRKRKDGFALPRSDSYKAPRPKRATGEKALPRHKPDAVERGVSESAPKVDWLEGLTKELKGHEKPPEPWRTTMQLSVEHGISPNTVGRRINALISQGLVKMKRFHIISAGGRNYSVPHFAPVK